MYRGVELTASLMCVDWLKAGDQIAEVQSACGAVVDFMHIDIIDGRFAHDFTMGSSIVDSLRSASRLPFDFHLMADEPSSLFDAFTFLEGDFLTIHQESSKNLHRNLLKIKNMDIKCGVALAPATPLTSLEYVLEELDLVNIMTVNPGYMGQPMVPQTLYKIQKLRAWIEDLGLDIKISVDGNVNFDTIPKLVRAGASRLVLGSSGLFRSDLCIAECLGRIKSSIDEGLEL